MKDGKESTKYSLCTTTVLSQHRPEEGVGVRSSESGVTNSLEMPCGCWGLNPGPSEEQEVLSSAELSRPLLFLSGW